MKDLAIQAPIAILMIIAVTFTFEFLFLQSLAEQDQENFNVDEPNNTSTFDFESDPGVFGVLGAIWDVITTFIDLLTFNIPGAPGYIRFVLSVIVNGSLAWSIAALIRGT